MAAAALVGTPVLLLCPQLLDEWKEEGAIGHFGSEAAAVAAPVTVGPGWTAATYPDPLRDASKCRNPNANSSERHLNAFFCDPDGVLDKAQVAEVTKKIVDLQKRVRVPCDMGSKNGSHSLPFYFGVAVVHRLGMHYGEPETNPGKCRSNEACLQTEVDWFGDAMLYKWHFGITEKGEYCPNGVVIVLATGSRFVRMRFLSDYFVDGAVASQILQFMRKDFANNDWEGGLLSAVDALARYFDLVYVEKGYTGYYWRYMLVASLFLAVGLALSLFGHERNQAVPPREIESEDAVWCNLALISYLLAALTSIWGLHRMTASGRYWNPDAENDSTLSVIPLYASLLAVLGLPFCCPMACGPIVRDSPLGVCILPPSQLAEMRAGRRRQPPSNDEKSAGQIYEYDLIENT